ncbi:MAG: processive 1,2-diacylglycerol beta-glucosyltransferase [Gaiellales bacterium]|nr:processive 1,2-diacylglycerol beta-glucosyltransferase [Gaiellales bacterium]
MPPADLKAALGAPERSTLSGDRPATMRVMIFTAPVGAGHNAAAAALGHDLTSRGHRVEIVDGLALLGIERLVVGSYRFQILHAGWSWRLLYRMTRSRRTIRLAGALLSLRAGPLRRCIAASNPDLIVSAYPIVSAALAGLRRRQRLPYPTATLVTDFDPHPCWVHPHLDANLVVGQAAAGTSPIRPPVSAPPETQVDLLSLRRNLGLTPGSRAILIVGGAWGVGNLLGAAEAALAVPNVHVIVVAGYNQALKRQLEQALDPRRASIFAFTPLLRDLMKVSDGLIQNAGGLTCLEAFAAGLPVIMFDPLPGHGEDNSAHMARAGVITMALNPAALSAVIALQSYWSEIAPATVKAALDLFTRPGAAETLEQIAGSPVSPSNPPRRRRALVTVALVLTCWFAIENPSQLSDFAAVVPPISYAGHASLL